MAGSRRSAALRPGWRSITGGYLDQIDGNAPLENEYVGQRSAVDVNATYQFGAIPGHPETLLHLKSTTNAPEVTEVGPSRALDFHYRSGRIVALGLTTEVSPKLGLSIEALSRRALPFFPGRGREGLRNFE